MSKEKTIEFGGSTITLKEGNMGVIVEIKTEDATVFVNDNLVWAVYDDEKFKFIPPIFRKFIQKYEDYNINRNDEDNLTTTDVYIGKESIMFIFPDNLSRSIYARIDFVDMDELIDDFINNSKAINDKEAKKLENMFRSKVDKINEIVEKYNWKFVPSHSCGEMFYSWWDIVLGLSNWNEEGFLEAIKEIESFNEAIREFMDKYF